MKERHSIANPKRIVASRMRLPKTLSRARLPREESAGEKVEGDDKANLLDAHVPAGHIVVNSMAIAESSGVRR